MAAVAGKFGYRFGPFMMRLLMLLPIALIVGGCARTVDIDARDEVNFAQLEGSIPLSEDGSLRLRVRGASADGDFDQTLDSDERVVFDGTRISGAAELDGEIDIDYYSVAVGKDRKYLDTVVGTWLSSFYVGVEQTDFDLTLEGRGNRISESDSSTAIYFQYLLDYVVRDDLEIGLGAAVSIDGDDAFSSEFDLRLEYAVYRQFRLVGGYRWYDFRFEPDESDSELEVEFRGPFLGLNLAF